MTTPTIYEILVRFDDDGSYVGSHFVLKTVYRDAAGNKAAEVLHPAAPIDDKAPLSLAEFLGEAAIAALAAADRARAEAEAAKSDREQVAAAAEKSIRSAEARATAATLEAEEAVASAKADAATSAAAASRLARSLDAANMEIGRMRAALESLSAERDQLAAAAAVAAAAPVLASEPAPPAEEGA